MPCLQINDHTNEHIHKNNRKRVIRALELYYGGVTKTEQNEQSRQIESPFEALYIGIAFQDRAKLYDRINQRVDKMVAAGLEAEAKTVLADASKTAKQAIGHKELQPYFEGSLTFEEAIDNIKKETRHYAKRQMTWFKRNKNTVWFYADTMTGEELAEAAAEKTAEFLNKKEG